MSESTDFMWPSGHEAGYVSDTCTSCVYISTPKAKLSYAGLCLYTNSDTSLQWVKSDAIG